MNVLVLNCGSATVKFQVFAVEPGQPPAGRIRGSIHPLSTDARLEAHVADGQTIRESVSATDPGAAIRAILALLRKPPVKESISRDGQPIHAVGHRVVHGGARYAKPALIDNALLAELDTLQELAPLHNAPSVAGICTAQEVFQVPMVAVFDTAFHHSLPEAHWRYPLPWDVSERHGIRRFGFHGTSYRYVLGRWRELTGTPLDQSNVVVLHLGNGASAVAIRAGCSTDTTMGFTPLEGLMMGTRCGDIDPSLVGFLAQKEGMSTGQVEHLLNTQSGLLGISGMGQDMRALLSAEASDPRARLAIDMFCHRARKAIGAMLAVLGGAKAVIFTGGIGENAPEIRRRICEDMGWCGVALDAAANAATAQGKEDRVSPAGATLPVWVIPTDEERMIAEDTAALLLDKPPRSHP